MDDHIFPICPCLQNYPARIIPLYAICFNNETTTKKIKLSCSLIQIKPPTALPKAPRSANVTVVKDTYVEIMWERTPDESDGKLRYSVDCFRCKSSKYKDCKESCGPSVEYTPNKDNVTDGTVGINGLPSDSFLKFRVYSVSDLNAQEKDRDKWNYVTVSAKTKGK